MSDDTTTPAESPENECKTCTRLSDDWVCAKCYSHRGKSLPSDAHGGGAHAGEPVADLTELSEGDRVKWGDRKRPLEVVRTTFGSHVIVEGPHGAIYRVQPHHNDGFRLGDRGGKIERFRRVERVDDATADEDEAGRPGGRGG